MLSVKRTGNLFGKKSQVFDSVAPAHSALFRNAALGDWRLTQTLYKRLNAIFLFMVSSRQVLGIRFFNGDADEAVQLMVRRGGFLIAPSGTCFARLSEDERYRRAILAADLAIADSGLMVVLCRLFRHESLQRISGLKYLKHLLATLKGAARAEVFWIVPSVRARQKLLDWSRRAGF